MKTLKLGAFLAICGAFLALALAGVNKLTAAKIAEVELSDSQSSLKLAYYTKGSDTKFCSFVVENDAVKEVNGRDADCGTINKSLFVGDITGIHIVIQGATKIGVVYQTSTKNDFGNVDMLTGINAQGKLHGWSALSSSSQSTGYGADLLKSGWFKVYLLDKTKAPSDMVAGASAAFNGAGVTKRTVEGAIAAVKDHFNANQGGLL